MKDTPKDVTFSVTAPKDVAPESGIELVVRAQNGSGNKFNVHCGLVANVVSYSGVRLSALKKRVEEKALAGNGGE